MLSTIFASLAVILFILSAFTFVPAVIIFIASFIVKDPKEKVQCRKVAGYLFLPTLGIFVVGVIGLIFIILQFIPS